MTQIHTSYKVSKMLKEFLGESAPEPMKPKYWNPGSYNLPGTLSKFHNQNTDGFPAYQLHDLLSKPFLGAMFVKTGVVDMTETDMGIEDAWDISLKINLAYFDGGLPAVEAELIKLMEGK